MKIELHSRICSSLTALYKRKNHDYGDSFGKSFAEYGMVMPCIRLEDKLNRLKALTRNGNQQVNDESIDDTLMDLANYAIMTMVERRMADGDDGELMLCRVCCQTCKFEKVPDGCEPCEECCFKHAWLIENKWEAKENASN